MERFDDLGQVAASTEGKACNRQTNAVVGDTSLREVVGADFGAAVASADL